MVNAAILVVAAGLLVGLLVAENRNSTSLILAFKTPLSVLFVVTTWVQPHPISSYFHLVLAGLVLGPQRRRLSGSQGGQCIQGRSCGVFAWPHPVRGCIRGSD